MATIANCVEPYCSARMHKCDSDSKCIPKPWLCDGEDDCADGSDELNCEHQTSCTSVDDFRCADEKHCVPVRWTCDGEADCPDRSDELHCPNITCEVDHVSCGAGKPCVHVSFLCDGHRDCPSGLDELPETCAARQCAEDEVRCEKGHQCISSRWLCDGDTDCIDASDESKCEPVTCKADEFRCSGAKGGCIPMAWRCDAAFDCADSSDETNCSVPASPSHCTLDEFTCRVTRECVHATWKCDGDFDCADGSDEHECPEKTCRPNEFQCRSTGNCIPSTWACDNTPQCDDKSDEDSCFHMPCNTHTEFDCNSGLDAATRSKATRNCIPIGKLCDSANDCGEKEDEAPAICRRDNTSSCSNNNGGCKHLCMNGINTTYCLCREGFRLTADNHSCEDIDECKLEGVGSEQRCSQLCENSRGGFKCACRPGYELDPVSRRECHVNGSEPMLLFSNRHDVRELYVRSMHYRPMREGLRNVRALDYDVRARALYVADASSHTISRFTVTAPGASTAATAAEVLVSGVKGADGLALDWVRGHLYWTDADRNTIEVISTGAAAAVPGQDRWRHTLVEKLDEPKAIVLDPREAQQYMYWTECGKAPRVARASMDGSAVDDVDIIADSTNGELSCPVGLALDLDSDVLFWVDSKLHRLVSYDLKSKSRRMIFQSFTHLRHPFSLTVFEDYVYWTDWQTNAIYKRNKFLSSRSANVTKIAQLLSSPTDIRIFHESVQPLAQDKCKTAAAPCSHLCLASSKYPGFSCACPDRRANSTVQYSLKNRRTCVASPYLPPPTTSTTAASPSLKHEEVGEVGASVTIQAAAQSSGGSVTGVAVGVSVLALVLVIIVLVVIVMRRYHRRNRKTMNFDNPMYRKRSEDQFSLDKNMQPIDSRLTPMMEQGEASPSEHFISADT